MVLGVTVKHRDKEIGLEPGLEARECWFCSDAWWKFIILTWIEPERPGHHMTGMWYGGQGASAAP